MNPRWLLAAMCVALAVPGLANAEEKSVNVAVVDLTYLFENYSKRSDLEMKFEARRKALAEQADGKKVAIQKKREDMRPHKPDSKEFGDLEQEVLLMEAEFEAWAGHQERLIKRQHKDWFLQIYEDVNNTVAALAKQSGIDLVLTYRPLEKEVPDSPALQQQLLLQNILYYDDRVDLTETVLRTLNAEYEKAGGAASLKLTSAGPKFVTAEPDTALARADISRSPDVATPVENAR